MAAATRMLLIGAIFAFLWMHTPFLLALAMLFYTFIWLAERLYRVFIIVAKIICFAYVAFLFVHSLSQYLPPEVPSPGRKDVLCLHRVQLLIHSLNF